MNTSAVEVKATRHSSSSSTPPPDAVPQPELDASDLKAMAASLYKSMNLHGDLDRALECLTLPHTQDVTYLETGTRHRPGTAAPSAPHCGQRPGNPEGSGGGNQATKGNAFYSAVDLIRLILKTAIRAAARHSGTPARIGIAGEDAVAAPPPPPKHLAPGSGGMPRASG